MHLILSQKREENGICNPKTDALETNIRKDSRINYGKIVTEHTKQTVNTQILKGSWTICFVKLMLFSGCFIKQIPHRTLFPEQLHASLLSPLWFLELGIPFLSTLVCWKFIIYQGTTQCFSDAFPSPTIRVKCNCSWNKRCISFFPSLILCCILVLPNLSSLYLLKTLPAQRSPWLPFSTTVNLNISGLLSPRVPLHLVFLLLPSSFFVLVGGDN